MPELIKSIKGISKIPSFKKWKKPRWAKPPILVDIVLEPDVPGEAPNILEDAALQGVMGSLPERIIWKWLQGQGYLFRVQQAEFGGRGQLGGVALDFVVFGMAAMPVALRVQGAYWHGPTSDRKALDDEQAGRLRMAGYLVVDLWEQDIYTAVRGHRLTAYVMERVI
jgi:G:T-mismatch repair DNA endonuclease (very short patch repair protein)